MKNEFTDAIQGFNFFIHDPKGAVYSQIVEVLLDQGVKRESIHKSAQNDPVVDYLKSKPRFINFHDVDGDRRQILRFLKTAEETYPNELDRVFILFSESHGVSDYVLALEEEIDDYIVSPFTTDKILKKIGRASNKKKNPTEYQALVSEIKESIRKKNFEVAVSKCEAALKIHPRPSAIYHLLAKIELEQGEKIKALNFLKRGLFYNKAHYKCLVLMHDIYLGMTDFDTAYMILKKALNLYPIINNRFLDLIRNNIMTSGFGEIEKYASRILEDANISEELSFFCTSSLLICAKNAANKDKLSHAQILILKSLTAHHNNPKILRNIFKTAWDLDFQNILESILSKFPQKTGPEYEFCVLLQDLNQEGRLNLHIDNFESNFLKTNQNFDFFWAVREKAKASEFKNRVKFLDTIGQRYGIL